MAEAMHDEGEPAVPQNLLTALLMGGDITRAIIDLYRTYSIDGLELHKDVWSPVHLQCFKRLDGRRNKMYWFWDLVGYYGSTQPIATTPASNTSDKILSMACIILGREVEGSFWSLESDRFIHELVDFDAALTIYYRGDPLEKLLKGLL